MPRIQIATLSLVALLAACPSTPKDAGGEFGDGKPVTNDGTLVKAPPAAPDFKNAMQLAPAFDKATGTLTVTLKLAPGFHAYGPGEEVGTPVALTVDEAKGGWKIEGAATIPAGKQKDLGALGKSVILEGDVALRAVVKGGSGECAGTVAAQICTDTACDRPKKHAFVVPTT